MIRGLVFSLSTLALFAAASIVQAESFRVVVTDDGHVCNDTQYGPSTTYSTNAVHIRSVAGRRRVGFFKFDVSANKNPGKVFANVCLDVFGYDPGGMTVYGVIESQENIAGAYNALTWSVVPGVQNNPLPAIDSPVTLTLDKADLVGPLVTFQAPAKGTRATTDPNAAMDVFFNSDTNGTVVLLLVPSAEGQNGILRSRRYNTTDCTYLVGDIVAGAAKTQALNPIPADGATDVYRDASLSWTPGGTAKAHNVYLGTNQADVENADAGNPLGVLVSQGQDANAFDPGRLQVGATYYWRVDEVNAPPDSTVFKGAVWNFTVEPAFYKVAGVTATASSFETSKGPENTVNNSGMNASDQHGTDGTTMWLTSRTATGPAWIQYAFDRIYKLMELKVWNYNLETEALLGFSIKDATIEYSTDGVAWTTLGDFQFAQAPGTANYAGNTTVSLGGIMAQYIRINVKSGWGMFGQYGLSEVQFLQLPASARSPVPASGTTDLSPETTLSWRSGRESASSRVYLGTDANALSLATQITGDSYAPANLTLGRTYYWRVDEVNDAASPSLWVGDVWSFSTRPYNMVDDFESYNDSDNRMFDVWVDGYGTTTNGSQVGYSTSNNATFGETTIIHGGKQSMPLAYDNSAALVSEAERTWDTAQDWTLDGADTLTLFVRGQPTGFQELATGRILMNGVGSDIFGTADQGRFVYKQLNGDGWIIARVDSLADTDPWAKAGVMIRQSLDAGSSWASVFATGSNGVRYQARLTTGGSATSDTSIATAAQIAMVEPVWIKIERVGNNFNCSYSADGKTWTAMAWNPQVITMNNPVYIGLAVTSHLATATTSAEYSNISTSANVTGSWASADLGITQPAGNTSDQLYLTIKDAAGKSKTVLADADIVLRGTWQEWQIPLSSLTGISTNRVKAMVIGVGDKTSPKHGKGSLYIDDIEVGHPAE